MNWRAMYEDGEGVVGDEDYVTWLENEATSLHKESVMFWGALHRDGYLVTSYCPTWVRRGIGIVAGLYRLWQRVFPRKAEVPF